MPFYLGIDTSNYTTSLALYDTESGAFRAAGKLLPVAEGALGLRQSDAVFEHTRQLPEVWEKLGPVTEQISAVGASVTPRRAEGSYMPCFLVGKTVGISISKALKIPFHDFSHQQGHLAAAIRGSGQDGLFGQAFLAFHVSGGTTDLLAVRDESLCVDCIGGSADLKAGQLVDRVGRLLGLAFPAGPALEKLAAAAEGKIPKIRCSVRGLFCNLSGGYNLCEKLYADTGSKELTARYCLSFIAEHLLFLARKAREERGNLPILFSGGVMSNQLIRARIEGALDRVFFAPPAWSADNARGIALLTAREEGQA